MLDNRLRKNLDVPLLLLTYLIALIGVVVLYSVTHSDSSPAHKKQLLWIVFGTVALTATTTLDYHMYSRLARPIYVINLLLLIFVLKFAHSVNGAARWIRIGGFPFQPSESAKLCIILTLAAFLTRYHDTIHRPKTLFLSLMLVLVPAMLIQKQPDLGTALVIIAIWFGMVFIAGARIRHLLGIVIGGSILFALVWNTSLIKTYQRERVRTLFTGGDSEGKGYHVRQARIAIGSGGVWGKGLLHSTHVKAGYIPEKQTDFVFTDIGEELGFFGAVALTVLYGCLIFRGTMVIAVADEDVFGKLIAAGIVTMLAFHVILNIGMNIGIMPVAGVPLPFVSAGGSNLIMLFACIGLLESVRIHRHELIF